MVTHMKKYVKILPLILYPYAYLLFLFFVYSTGKLVKEGTTAEVEIFSALGMIAVVLYNLWVLILSLGSAIGGLKRYTPAEAAKMNLAVKLLQIPAYLFHFLMGAMGLLMSVWGIGFIGLAVAVDLITIFLSGLFAVGSVRRMKKEGILSSGTTFWTGFGSFIYCVDIIIAIVLVAMCKTQKNGTTVGKAAPPLTSVPPISAPVQDEIKSETASPSAASVPQQKRRKASEMPLPPPLPPAPQKPAPAPTETREE